MYHCHRYQHMPHAGYQAIPPRRIDCQWREIVTPTIFHIDTESPAMRIDSKEKIGNHAILDVRNALRKCMWSFDIDDLARALKTSTESANSVVQELVKRGWCEISVQGGWEITGEGARFLCGKSGPPINRKKAQLLLNTVIERATAFELAFPLWPLHVEKIAVFGSYLSDTDALGDLDVALMMVRRPSMMNRESMDAARTLAQASGCSTRSSFDSAGGFLYSFLIQQLGKRIPAVSFHEWSDITELECKHEVVWTSNSIE